MCMLLFVNIEFQGVGYRAVSVSFRIKKDETFIRSTFQYCEQKVNEI